jgi:uncharacterized protein (TIGR02600 family)
VQIWDTHDIGNPDKRPVQTMEIGFPASLTAPPPELGGVNASPTSFSYDSNNVAVYNRARMGPHWWCFNWQGCVDRFNGKVNPNYKQGGAVPFWSAQPTNKSVTDNDHQPYRGRLDVDGSMPTFSITPNRTAGGLSLAPDANSDVYRTLVPAMGDYRMLAALKTVPASMWEKHPQWDNSALRTVHNFSGIGLETGSLVGKGADGVTDDPNLALVAGAPYGSRRPDMPNNQASTEAANSFGDFDTGIGNAREGPYINKPDEGNFYARFDTVGNKSVFNRRAYIPESYYSADDWRSGIYMTPNRMVSSPVMFGSLPTGIWPGSSVSGSRSDNSVYQPWQTLLFRPYVKNVTTGKDQHPGQSNPMDHYILDLFFMPVVEPYAISEPLSEAGKVNMNYQILPFTNIRRATGMHAVLKGEFMTAIPTTDVVTAKTIKDGALPVKLYGEAKGPNGGAGDGKYWHRPLDVAKTLKQFDERFDNRDSSVPNQVRGLFRSASQICETYLIPKTDLGTGDILNRDYFGDDLTYNTRKAKMTTFWQAHNVTGENIRERAYSNIYSRVTTRSNTFRVHVRAQVIKKARSSDPATFEVGKDAVLSEYRGSTVIERYIDPNDRDHPLPDYGASQNPLNLDPLDKFYRYRVLETKRFNP